MRYLSLFSGIEGATLAWRPLGWEACAFAEVEAFPCAVLKHHYPQTPNLGDVRKIGEDDIRRLGRIDLIVGGFPCQDVSVAGKRAGMRNDDGSHTRSGLFFEAMRLVRHARVHSGLRWLLVENVPGLFSSNDGRDFALVVGEMAGCEFDVPRDGWRNAGFAAGPDGLVEWATLDAQFFGLAQRRSRVFALADFGDWQRRSPILLEPNCLHRHPAPRREARERAAPTISARASAGGGLGTDFDCDSGLIDTAAFGGNRQGGEIDIATAVNAHGGPHGRLDFESETLLVAFTAKDSGGDLGEDISPTLRAGDYAASHANGGIGPAIATLMPDLADPISASEAKTYTHEGQKNFRLHNVVPVAIPITADALRGEGTALTPSADAEGRIRLRDPGLGIGEDGDPAPTLAAAGPGAVFTLAVRGRGDTHQLEFRDDELANALLTPNGGRAGIGVGAVAFVDRWNLTAEGDTSGTISTAVATAGGHAVVTPFDPRQLGSPGNWSEPQPGDPSHPLRAVANAQPAVAFNITPSQGNIDYNARPTERAQALTGNGNRVSARGGDLVGGSMVRRLTPVECCRLQGFPDTYLDIPFRGKPAADGPKYKALGNSFATPVIRWLGERIAAVMPL